MLEVPATVEMARKLTRLSVKHNLRVDPRVGQLFDAIPRAVELPGFNFKLKLFQAEGVAWLESQLGTGLLADEQGTGLFRRRFTQRGQQGNSKPCELPSIIKSPLHPSFSWTLN